MPDHEVTLLRRNKIGFIFQFFNLLPTLTAIENVMLPLILDGRSTAPGRSRAGALLSEVGLESRGDHLPEELSGGEIQRLAIARALAFNPPILLADEPTGNLDSKTGEGILKLLRQINREEGSTVVMVTHNREAAGCGDRVIYLRDGKLEQEGP
jgi:putative ABC transport system ATP-binding protein